MAIYLHRDYLTGAVTQHATRAGAPSVPTPLREQEPIGPAFAAELRRAGCGEGVTWESRRVEHPITRQPIPRITGLVTVTDGWAHNAARVQAVMVAHDPTLPDPLARASVSEWDLELLDGMTRKGVLHEREQRAMLRRLADWAVREAGDRRDDADPMTLRAEARKPTLDEAATRTLVARVRARVETRALADAAARAQRDATGVTRG